MNYFVLLILLTQCNERRTKYITEEKKTKQNIEQNLLKPFTLHNALMISTHKKYNSKTIRKAIE